MEGKVPEGMVRLRFEEDENSEQVVNVERRYVLRDQREPGFGFQFPLEHSM
jgi:hypothetical protein